MQWIKLTRDSSKGNKGDIIQVSPFEAETWIKSGMAKESEAPKKRGVHGDRPNISNKAMSA